MGSLRTGLVLSAMLMLMGVVLAGCAVQKMDQAPASAGESGEMATVKIPAPEDFTTEGKPTKTIQTLNDPVEIYDPTKDPEVRAAFKVVYDKNAFPVTSNGYPRDKNGNPVHGKEGDLLIIARNNMISSLLRNGICSKIRDATGIGLIELRATSVACHIKLVQSPSIKCDTSPQRTSGTTGINPRTSLKSYEGLLEQIRAKRLESPTAKENLTFIDTIPAAIDDMVVLTNTTGKTIISTDYKIIGPISPEPFDEQVKWFFSYACFN